MRFLSAPLALALAATLAWCQAPGLVVEGETKVLVSKLPFKVVAPKDADLYFWKAPAGWKVKEVGKTLEVAEAPQGEHAVALQTLTIDWANKKTVTEAFSLSLVVGKVTPPPPFDPLVASLKAAYDGEADPQKGKLIASLAALYRQAAGITADPVLKTWGDLHGAMSAAARTLGVSGKLPAVQAALQAELRRALPTDAATALDDAGRVLAKDTFTRAAAALTEAGK